MLAQERKAQVASIDDNNDKTTRSSKPLTKRQRALHELLSSERVYASELALIHEVHAPLALGQRASFPGLPPHLTVSDSATAHADKFGPPTTEHDVSVIFGGVCEVSEFSSVFCFALAKALGNLVEGGEGEDHVGALFLATIPRLEQLYKQYITCHPAALTHLQQLSSAPTVQDYLSYTQASLLTKPVQRLLKYPLLLTTIINETPDTHPDKQDLLEARQRILAVARNSGITPHHVASYDRESDKGEYEETVLVARLEKELKQLEDCARKYAKNTIEWVRMTSNPVWLHSWSLDFAPVIGISEDQHSEVLHGLLAAVEAYLMPSCVDLEASFNERVSRELARMLATISEPLKLFASMNEQEPNHYLLMNMNAFSKIKPSPSLLAASTNYLALRGQLAAGLPTYIGLLHRQLKIFIQKLSNIQAEFWTKVRERWAGMWGMEDLEGGAPYEEALDAWRLWWSQTSEQFAARPPPPPPPPLPLQPPSPPLSPLLSFPLVPLSPEPPPLLPVSPLDKERREDPEADAEIHMYHPISTPTHQAQVPPPGLSSRQSLSTLCSSDATSIYYSDIFGTPSSFAMSIASRRSTTVEHDHFFVEENEEVKEMAEIQETHANFISGGPTHPHPLESQREGKISDASSYEIALLPSVGLGLSFTLSEGGDGDGEDKPKGKPPVPTTSTTTIRESLYTHRGTIRWTEPELGDLEEFEAITMGQRELGRQAHPSKGERGRGSGTPGWNGHWG